MSLTFTVDDNRVRGQVFLHRVGSQQCGTTPIAALHTQHAANRPYHHSITTRLTNPHYDSLPPP